MAKSKLTKQQKISIGVVLWVSFVGAGVATMLFFATFDPTLISNVATFSFELDRSTGYSVGFFLFWLLLAFNGAVTAWLLTRPNKNSDDNDA